MDQFVLEYLVSMLLRTLRSITSGYTCPKVKIRLRVSAIRYNDIIRNHLSRVSILSHTLHAILLAGILAMRNVKNRLRNSEIRNNQK